MPKKSQLVYIDAYGLGELRRYLKSKGWKVIGREDKNVDSQVFNFRTSKGVNEKMLSKMFKQQVCNHFMGVRCMTTKWGLC